MWWTKGYGGAGGLEGPFWTFRVAGWSLVVRRKGQRFKSQGDCVMSGACFFTPPLFVRNQGGALAGPLIGTRNKYWFT